MVSLLFSKKGKLHFFFLLLLLSFCSCKKLIAIDAPQTSINEENVYKSDFTAIAAVTGIYASISDVSQVPGFTGSMSLSLLTGLSSDELTLYSGVTDTRLLSYYKNALMSTSSQNYGSELWNGSGGPGLYNYIFRCNAAIKGLSSSNSLTPAVKQQLLGEAKFMRAFFYFYLVNLFGDVPLALTTDPAININLARTSQNEVYQQIVIDLKDAQELLSPVYLNGTLISYVGIPERIRPTKWAAMALLARVYLYINDWINAEAQASLVISNISFFSLDSLQGVFLKNSKEAIWQLQPVKANRNTEDAFSFILPSTGPTVSANLNPVYLSSQLLNSFEKNDQRKINWINSALASGVSYYYPYKYKATAITGSVTEYLMILRLAEQFLIRAEARIQQNNIVGAQSDLNNIRIRAGLQNTTANDKSSLIDAILRERQVELFTELGHRWFDLKRTGLVNTIMSSVTPTKGGVWNSEWQLYPVPFDDIQRNTRLVQNPGY